MVHRDEIRKAEVQVQVHERGRCQRDRESWDLNTADETDGNQYF